MQTNNIKRKAKSKRGGPRPNSGRPPKLDKDQWVEANVRLRRDTVERLREGAGSKLFGKFLQEHLDRFPPPSRAQYLASAESYRKFRTPASELAARRAERERKRLESLTPRGRVMEQWASGQFGKLFGTPKELKETDIKFKQAMKEARREEARLAKERGIPVTQMFPSHDVAGKAVSR